MKFLQNISINNKLLFIVFVPLLALIVLAGMKIFELQERNIRQTALVELMDISVATSNLVHELQKERGASAGFIGSKGKNFADILPKQTMSTDEKRASLQSILENIDTSKFDQAYNEALQTALNDLEKIDAIRKKVSVQNISVPDAVAYYTNLNADFLGITGQAIFVAKDPNVIRDVSAYLSFLQSKERAGIERAIGAAGFGGGWNAGLISKFANLITIQNTYLSVFETYADNNEKAFYEEKIKDPIFAKVEDMRKQAFASEQSTGSTTNVTATKWFDTITKKINILKEIENHLSERVIHVAQSEAYHAKTQMSAYIAILGVLISVTVVLTIIILKDLLHSIRNTKEVMGDLAKGNTDIEVVGTNRKDEIGGMAKSIEIFKQGLIEKKQMEEEALKAQARSEEEKRKVMLALAADFDTMVGGLINSLASASTELQSTAENMSSIAEQTSQSSASVASSTEEASANVSTVASAMEEMSSSSDEIASQVTSAKTKSNDTAENAQNANNTVRNLNTLVENIGEVVTAIEDIAEQTNLLALNATIESARAGEAGKGFAVVASEVKSLANETGKKTGEIKSQIAEIQAATRASVSAMEHIIRNISDIDESVTGVSAAVEEQNSTTSEIVRSISEASQGVQQVAHVILDVQKGADETGSSANAVLEASREVSKLSENLKSAVNQFLSQIRGNENETVEDTWQNTGT